MWHYIGNAPAIHPLLMLQNYIKIALRTMLRNKSYSLINIIGLSIGVACCLLLSLYIQSELSVDQHHQNLSTIYRINTTISSDNNNMEMGTTSPPIAPTLADELEEITVAARLVNPPGVAQNLIRYDDKMFYEPNGFIADSTLFEVLTYEFIEGNPQKALREANSTVINQTMARKLFGDEPALNKVIAISQGGEPIDYKVTGVIKEEKKSFIQANFFISMTSSSGMANYLRSENAMGEWAGQNFIPAFVKLREDADPAIVANKMNEVLLKYGAEDLKAIGFQKKLALEPLQDIYLRSTIGQEARIKYLMVIGTIAVFVLLIACINFMNLATAKATKRANEVGLRKVMGAFRSALVRQFMGEALMIVLIAILISVVLIQGALPYFNQLTGKEIVISIENSSYFIGALLIITLVTGLVAGSYPAFYLSSFQPAQVLKGKQALRHSSGWLRRSLVVFQFVIAIGLVCGMIIISQQIDFMQNKELGFDSNAKVILPLRTESARKNYEALKSELASINSVKGVSGTEYVPGAMIWSDMSFYAQGGSMEKAILNRRNTIDYGYLEMMDIKIIAGRKFNDNRESESKGKLIVNRTSAKELGFTPESIIGQPLFFDWQGQQYTFEVIGVMEDYHQTSLKDRIFPIMFEMTAATDQLGHAVVSIEGDALTSTLPLIEAKWKQLVPDTPFEYSFLDENIQKLYLEDQKVSDIITSFTIIAMFISCLGLYGLSSFMAERRFKEIGVRKVLGANVNQIVGLMSKEFIKLVAASFLIAVPLAWYGMSQWLSGFAYQIEINPVWFAWAGLGALMIALLTVSFESIRAAMSNPVESLRNE